MNYEIGEQVTLEIENETPLGYNVIINNIDEGLLFHSEVFEVLDEGMALPGYIKNIREDGKIDVSLRPQGFENVIDQDVDAIVQKLESNRGILYLSDKSSPDAIREKMNMSKKAFKKAIGKLYREKVIEIEEKRIVLVGREEKVENKKSFFKDGKDSKF